MGRGPLRWRAAAGALATTGARTLAGSSPASLRPLLGPQQVPTVKPLAVWVACGERERAGCQAAQLPWRGPHMTHERAPAARAPYLHCTPLLLLRASALRACPEGCCLVVHACDWCGLVPARDQVLTSCF